MTDFLGKRVPKKKRLKNTKKNWKFAAICLSGTCGDFFIEVVYHESMKRKLISNLYMSVGVMEDYKLRDLRASHTLGWSWNWKT